MSRKHKIPTSRKVAVLERDGWTCHYCQHPLTRDLTPSPYGDGGFLVPEGFRYGQIDHVIPFSKGGTHKADNLVACCPNCNSRKGAKSTEEWSA